MRSVTVLALLLVACGGSSSETPPPLEPDPTGYRYAGPRIPGRDEPVAAQPEAEAEVDEDDLPPKKPAPSTWGSGRTGAAPRAAASIPPLTPLPAPSLAPAPPAAPPASAAPAPSATPARP